jgi:hypothetical protein
MAEDKPPMPEGQDHSPAPEIDPIKLEHYLNQLRDNQNFTLALLGGAAAALAGAIVWSAITYFTNYQLGILAIGIGFLVGLAVRKLGNGIDTSFGIAGAVLALLGCAVGNLLTICVLVAEHEGREILEVVYGLTLSQAWEWMVASFNPFDAVFYASAAYYGYQYSIRRLSDEEIQQLIRR